MWSAWSSRLARQAARHEQVQPLSSSVANCFYETEINTHLKGAGWIIDSETFKKSPPIIATWPTFTACKSRRERTWQIIRLATQSEIKRERETVILQMLYLWPLQAPQPRPGRRQGGFYLCSRGSEVWKRLFWGTHLNDVNVDFVNFALLNGHRTHFQQSVYWQDGGNASNQFQHLTKIEISVSMTGN